MTPAYYDAVLQVICTTTTQAAAAWKVSTLTQQKLSLLQIATYTIPYCSLCLSPSALPLSISLLSLSFSLFHLYLSGSLSQPPISLSPSFSSTSLSLFLHFCLSAFLSVTVVISLPNISQYIFSVLLSLSLSLCICLSSSSLMFCSVMNTDPFGLQ